MARDPNITIEISDENEATPTNELVKVLLIGIKLAAGAGTVNVPTRVYSTADVIQFAGEGSQLVQMDRALRSQNPGLDVTIIALTAPVGAAAAGTITFGGTATTAQPVVIQVEDKTVTIPVAIGDDGDAIAATAETLLGTSPYSSLHVTAAVDGVNADELDFTARSHGVHGNGISLKILSVPPGVTASVTTAMASGSGNPDLATALAALGDVRYNYVVLPDTDSTNLASFKTVAAARFTGDTALDMHGIACLRDSVSNLATLGLSLDDKNLSIFGDPSVPSNPWVQAAVVAAARATQTNPKMSIRNTDLVGIVAPDPRDYLDPDDRTTLLNAGISCYYYVNDVPRVNRFLTLGKTNNLGQATEAWLDVETKLTVSEIRAADREALRPFLGYIWTSDASSTQYDVDVQIIDPEGLRQVLINQYRTVYMRQGWVDRPDEWEALLSVTKTSNTAGTYTSKPIINGLLYDVSGTLAFQLG